MRYSLNWTSNALFLGGPWIVAVFQLPQRLQLINKISPLGAGIRFIPFTLAAPVGSVIASIIAKAGKVPPLYLLMFAAAVQIVGFALLATLPVSQSIAVAQYGYEFIAGFGCGISIALLPLMTPFSVEARDLGKFFNAYKRYHSVANTTLSGSDGSHCSTSYDGRRDRPRHCDHGFQRLGQIQAWAFLVD